MSDVSPIVSVVDDDLYVRDLLQSPTHCDLRKMSFISPHARLLLAAFFLSAACLFMTALDPLLGIGYKQAYLAIRPFVLEN